MLNQQAPSSGRNSVSNKKTANSRNTTDRNLCLLKYVHGLSCTRYTHRKPCIHIHHGIHNITKVNYNASFWSTSEYCFLFCFLEMLTHGLDTVTLWVSNENFCYCSGVESCSHHLETMGEATHSILLLRVAIDPSFRKVYQIQLHHCTMKTEWLLIPVSDPHKEKVWEAVFSIYLIGFLETPQNFPRYRNADICILYLKLSPSASGVRFIPCTSFPLRLWSWIIEDRSWK